MSGIESWAIVAPSVNSTMPWTTDWGCTTTSIWSKSTPNSSWASITSRPLFMSVDESTVILGPMFQVGMVQRIGHRHRGQLGPGAAPERPAAGGQDDLGDLAGPPRAQRLVDRGVLGVDRHDLATAVDPGLGDHRSAGDEALLVREREPLAVRRARPAWPAARRTRRRRSAPRRLRAATARSGEHVRVRHRRGTPGRPEPRTPRPARRAPRRCVPAASATTR